MIGKLLLILLHMAANRKWADIHKSYLVAEPALNRGEIYAAIGICRYW